MKTQFLKVLASLVLFTGLAGCLSNEETAASHDTFLPSFFTKDEFNRREEDFRNEWVYDFFGNQHIGSVSHLRQMTPTQRAFYSLRKICEKTPRAHWSEYAKECYCPRGQAFLSENAKGQCISFVGMKPNLSFSFLPGTSAWGAAIPGRPIQFEISNAPASIFIQNFNATHFAEPSIDLTPASIPVYRTQVILTGRRSDGDGRFAPVQIPEPSAISSRYLLAQPFFKARAITPLRRNGDINVNVGLSPEATLFLYEPNPALLSQALIPFEHSNGVIPEEFESWVIPTNVAPQDDQALAVLNRAYLAFKDRIRMIRSKPYLPTHAEDSSLAGCAESCQTEASLELPPSLSREFIAKEIRTYLLGVPNSRLISVFSRANDTLLASLLLNPAGGVSLVALPVIPALQPTQPLTSATSQIHSGYQIFDRQGRLLSDTRTHTSVPQVLKEATHFAEQMSSTSTTEPMPTSILCDATLSEESFRSLNAQHLVKDLLRGPYSSTLGWMDTHPQDIKNTLAGLFTHQKNSPLFTPSSVETHPVQVLSAFLARGKSAQMIPLEADLCTDPNRAKHWKENVRAVAPHAKVANLSFGLSLDQTVCEENYGAVFEDTSHPILWITAAGNDLLTHARLSCPQNLLAGRDNGIVVAAVDRDPEPTETLARRSNRGVRSVDIAAIAESEFRVEWERNTSSLAAPVVARVASEIVFELPTLSIAQVRLSILASAHIPGLREGVPRPLEVRSGGILDPEAALRFARKLAQIADDTTSIHRIVHEQDCGSNAPCHASQLRIQLLKQGGVL